MNTAKILTATAGVALLLSTALPALATETSNSTSVEVESSTEVEGEVEHPREGGGYRLDIEKNRKTASSTREQKERRDREEREHRLASSSEDRRLEREDRKASTTGERMEKRAEKVQEKAGEAIEKRIKSLIELKARLANIKLLSADQLASLTATLDTEIASLTALQGKIAAGTATSTLKSDVKSITQDHRVFQLVEPKARIAAAASRIKAVATQLELLSTKLQERITAAQAAGTDVAAATAALADFNLKVADAKVQADAAVSLTASLAPDNGDKTVLEANKKALKDARTKLVNGEKDLAAARHDAATIYGVVKGKGEVKTTTTTP